MQTAWLPPGSVLSSTAAAPKQTPRRSHLGARSLEEPHSLPHGLHPPPLPSPPLSGERLCEGEGSDPRSAAPIPASPERPPRPRPRLTQVSLINPQLLLESPNSPGLAVSALVFPGSVCSVSPAGFCACWPPRKRGLRGKLFGEDAGSDSRPASTMAAGAPGRVGAHSGVLTLWLWLVGMAHRKRRGRGSGPPRLRPAG